MATRSKQLAAVETTAAGFTHLYTCPENRVTIVKSWWGYNASGAARDIVITVDYGGTGRIFVPPMNAAVPSIAVTPVVNSWWVMKPGDILEGYASGANVHFLVSGAELVA